MYLSTLESSAVNIDLYIVTELCKGGNLYHVNPDFYNAPEVAAGHFHDLCTAVDFLHQSGIVHRDIKSALIVHRPSERAK